MMVNTKFYEDLFTGSEVTGQDLVVKGTMFVNPCCKFNCVCISLSFKFSKIGHIVHVRY
ncbi:hypothetical protein B7P43_G01002 [Cryptotermes secundus]|uniref:Uncharacterized protein n=1 Tax=Cryptotermes secundus TaxID=105785 RepID=A0A2J7PG56_9NEOP|nr:hypothetical protein B7P43_G01002 [Cryptotermes secundus]